MLRSYKVTELTWTHNRLPLDSGLFSSRWQMSTFLFLRVLKYCWPHQCRSRGTKNWRRHWRRKRSILQDMMKLQNMFQNLMLAQSNNHFITAVFLGNRPACVPLLTPWRLYNSFSSKLYGLMIFPEVEQQEQLFIELQNVDHRLYGGLDCTNKTLFLWQTGNNFSSFHLPTQQILCSAKHQAIGPSRQFLRC